MHLNLIPESVSDHARSATRAFAVERPGVAAALTLWVALVWTAALLAVLAVGMLLVALTALDRLPTLLGVVGTLAAATLSAGLRPMVRREWRSFGHLRAKAAAKRERVRAERLAEA